MLHVISQNWVEPHNYIVSCYHIYCLLTNTTTIEGWEKDKVATLVRRGKIREVSRDWLNLVERSILTCHVLQVKFPYVCLINCVTKYNLTSYGQNLGIKENVYSVFGPSPLYWPFPIKETSSGLKFRIAPGEGKWIEFHHNDYEMENVASRNPRYAKDMEGGRDLEA